METLCCQIIGAIYRQKYIPFQYVVIRCVCFLKTISMRILVVAGFEVCNIDEHGSVMCGGRI